MPLSPRSSNTQSVGRAPDIAGPVLLTGTGSSDDQEIERLFQRYMALDFLDQDLSLPLNYSGEVEFSIKMRFHRVALRTVDHTLNRRSRVMYEDK